MKQISKKMLVDLIFKAWKTATKQYEKIRKSRYDPISIKISFEYLGLMDAYEAILYALKENSSTLLEIRAGRVNIKDYEIDKKILIDLINDARHFSSRMLEEETIPKSNFPYYHGTIRAYDSVLSALYEGSIELLKDEI